MRSTEQFLADCRAISDVPPSELTAGDYFAINKANGQHCIVRLSGEAPQLVLGCLQFPLRTSIKDFRFLDRVPTWERYRELKLKQIGKSQHEDEEARQRHESYLEECRDRQDYGSH